jgi:hypothetical protein
MLNHSYVLSMLVYADYWGVWLASIQCMAIQEVRLTASLTKPFLFMLGVF